MEARTPWRTIAVDRQYTQYRAAVRRTAGNRSLRARLNQAETKLRKLRKRLGETRIESERRLIRQQMNWVRQMFASYYRDSVE